MPSRAGPASRRPTRIERAPASSVTSGAGSVTNRPRSSATMTRPTGVRAADGSIQNAESHGSDRSRIYADKHHGSGRTKEEKEKQSIRVIPCWSVTFRSALIGAQSAPIRHAFIRDDDASHRRARGGRINPEHGIARIRSVTDLRGQTRIRKKRKRKSSQSV
jgi:hypothetical protein